jgi:hypothetical protein
MEHEPNNTSKESDTRKVVGLAALYDDVDTLIQAARKVRQAGYRKWDCHTPYPVHGLDRAMGLRSSPVPFICLVMGFIGVQVALLMQGWMNVQDYPIIIGGKPLFSGPAFVPITFEVFVLFAALTITGCLIVFCRLWRWRSPLHDNGIMAEITGARFAVVLDARDTQFSEEQAQTLLKETGSTDIRPLYEPQDEGDSFI